MAATRSYELQKWSQSGHSGTRLLHPFAQSGDSVFYALLRKVTILVILAPSAPRLPCPVLHLGYPALYCTTWVHTCHGNTAWYTPVTATPPGQPCPDTPPGQPCPDTQPGTAWDTAWYSLGHTAWYSLGHTAWSCSWDTPPGPAPGTPPGTALVYPARLVLPWYTLSG